MNTIMFMIRTFINFYVNKYACTPGYKFIKVLRRVNFFQNKTKTGCKGHLKSGQFHASRYRN